MSDWFKRVFLGIAVLGLLAAAPAQAQNGRGQGNGAGASANVVQLRPTGPVPGQYIVVFEDDVADPRGLANALARRSGFAVQHVYEFALKGFAGNMPAPVAEMLALDPDVAYVEQDLYAHAVLHANAFQTLPTGVKRIDADLNAAAVDPVNVDIAILDTGVDFEHPDLNVFRRVNCANGGPFTQKCEDGEGDDGNGHGTHVAGTAAARGNDIGVVGVAPGARIWALKVLRDDGSGWFSWSIAALDYVTQHASEIEVANMSLSGQGTLDSLRTAIQGAVNAGVVIVVAAGNGSRDVYGDGGFGTGDETIPASYPEAMTVSALADFDGLPGGLVQGDEAKVIFESVCPQTDNIHTGDDVFACFTNYSNTVTENPVTSAGNPVTSPGAAIDVAGPGLNILSTWMDGMYATISGTSMASPHVAGAVALYIAANGRANDAGGVADIRQALIDAAKPQTDWLTTDTNNNLGTKDPDGNHEGLVDAAGAPAPGSDYPPSVSWYNPVSGNVSGAVALEITATDDLSLPGDVTVEWRVAGDPSWQTATYDTGTGTYKATWVTTGGSFPDGPYTLEAQATDNQDTVDTADDNTSSIASVGVTVDNEDDPPAVSWVSPGADSNVSGAVALELSAPDDRSLPANVTVEWRVVDDPSWQTATYDTGTGTYKATWDTTVGSFPDGPYTLEARATDNQDTVDTADDNVSAPVSIGVTVQNAMATAVSVDSVSYATTGGKGGDKHLLITVALLDDLGGGVSGASVSITLTRAEGGEWNGAGATDEFGEVTFSLKNAKSGCYSTTVTGVTADGLTWDGATPATEDFCK